MQCFLEKDYVGQIQFSIFLYFLLLYQCCTLHILFNRSPRDDIEGKFNSV